LVNRPAQSIIWVIAALSGVDRDPGNLVDGNNALSARLDLPWRDGTSPQSALGMLAGTLELRRKRGKQTPRARSSDLTGQSTRIRS
jgi:hypothetical protein